MKITKVTLSIGRTINLGNYQSARIDLSMETSGDWSENEVTSIRKTLASTIKHELNIMEQEKQY